MIVVLVGLSLVMMGCTPTIAVQGSGLRFLGDVSISVTLDDTSEAGVAAKKAKVIEVCDKVLEALGKDAPSTTLISELRTKVLAAVPVEYQPFVKTGFDKLTQSLDDVVDANAIFRLRAFFVGAKVSAQEYIRKVE